MAKLLIHTFLLLLLVLLSPFIAFSEEIYEYERMWPVVEQPWYFFWPHGIAVDSSGNVYVAETWNCRVQKFTLSGQFVTRWGGEGSGDGQLNYPNGIAADSSGNLYVADTENHRIQKFTSSGQFITKWGSSGSVQGQFNLPIGIAVDSSANVYAAAVYGYAYWHMIRNGTGDISSPLGDELAAGCKLLNPVIPCVSHIDVTTAVYGYACWAIKLTVPTASAPAPQGDKLAA